MKLFNQTLFQAALLSVALAFGCVSSGGGDQPAADGPAADGPAADAGPSDRKLAKYNTDLPQVKYRLDPQAGDKGVPAEMGGPGWKGKDAAGNQYETNLEFPSIGKQGGVPQGGVMTQVLLDWPATLRMAGQNWNTSFNYRANSLCFEGLLKLHPLTMEWIPSLATHWWISDDKTTYRFRIDPRAKWSDGKPITARDVVATWKLRTDSKILDPNSNVYYGRLNEPKAISKYLVEVTVKEESWRNFMVIAGMSVLPAAQISIPGDKYLDKFQFKYTATSGPYTVDEADIVTGQTISIKRRNTWWAQDQPAWEGMYNIGQYKFVVVKDINLAYEKIKKGELDYFVVPKAQWWAEEIPGIDEVKRGLLVAQKFYTDAPIGTSGIAINTARPPLDDVKIRKAMQLLHDRATLIKKLYFNEYEPLTSYWQGGTYANPDNELLSYDDFGAVELLEGAGWTKVNDQGYRVKGGRELAFTLTYRTPLSERSLTVFQEACKKAGIKIELQLLTPAAAWKNLQGKEYDLMSTAWGTILFPNPESSWHSKFSEEINNNNVTAFADPRVDKLIERYNGAYDVNERVALIREMDGIIYNQHPYVLEWFNPAQRVLYWNKYGMPEWGSSRTSDTDDLHFIWWVDPLKEKQLKSAMQDPHLKMDPGEAEVRFWQAWHKAGGAEASKKGAGGDKPGEAPGDKSGKSGKGKAARSGGE